MAFGVILAVAPGTAVVVDGRVGVLLITGNRRTEALRSAGRLLALRRTVMLALSVPRDRTSLRVFGEALGGARWVLAERRPVPAIEAGLASLDGPQRRSTARRYVG